MTLREFDLAQILQSLELNLDKIHTTTLLTQLKLYLLDHERNILQKLYEIE